MAVGIQGKKRIAFKRFSRSLAERNYSTPFSKSGMNKGMWTNPYFLIFSGILIFFFWNQVKTFFTSIWNLIFRVSNPIQEDCEQELSHSLGFYQLQVDTLYPIINRSWNMTHESSIRNIFQTMYNDCDVYELIDTFGTKTYMDIIPLGLNDRDMRLPQMLREELNEFDLETYVNQPLRSNGVNYQF